MTIPEHIAELWLRNEAGLPLSDEEQTLLVSALAGDESLRRSLLADSAFDAELRSLSHIDSSEDAFATEFSRRLAIANHVQAPPVQVATAWVQPPPVQAVLPVTPAAFVAPLPTARPAVVKSVVPFPTRRPRKPDFTLAVACAVFIMAGAVVLYVTIARDRPDESRPVVKNIESNPRPDNIRPRQQSHEQSVDSLAPEGTIPLVQPAVPAVQPTVVESSSSPRQLAPSRQSAAVPIWYVGGPRSDRLPAGRHELNDGLVTLNWDNDREMELAAPAVVDVGADDKLTLLRGTLRTTKVAPPMGLMVDTPTSRVFDRGGRFEVAVDDTGVTKVVVAEGRCACQPGAATDKPGKLFELSKDLLDRVKVFNRVAAPGDFVATAIASVATGKDNQFLGQVAVNGETVEFSSPKAFEEFSQRALGQFQQAPEQFLKQWSEMLKSLGNLDGAFPELPGGTSTFQGVININGQEQRFNSRAEYEAALKNFLP